MSAIWWLLLGGAALAAASTLFKVRKVQQLPDISNKEFLNVYRLRFTGSDNAVLAERKAIAECLGIPQQKLSPNQTFKSLSKYTGFITEYEIGMSDLGDELARRYEQAGMKTPQAFPETVGEFIHEIIDASERSRDHRRTG